MPRRRLERFWAVLSELNPQDLANMMWGFATADPVDALLFVSLAMAAVAMALTAHRQLLGRSVSTLPYSWNRI